MSHGLTNIHISQKAAASIFRVEGDIKLQHEQEQWSLFEQVQRRLSYTPWENGWRPLLMVRSHLASLTWHLWKHSVHCLLSSCSLFPSFYSFLIPSLLPSFLSLLFLLSPKKNLSFKVISSHQFARLFWSYRLYHTMQPVTSFIFPAEEGSKLLQKVGTYQTTLYFHTNHCRGGSFTGDPKGYERKALEMGISLHGGSAGQPGVGSFTRDFERWLKGGSRNAANLSVGALWGEPGRGLLYWGPWRICRKGSGDGHLSPHGPHYGRGEPGTGLIYCGLWKMDEGGSRSGASLSESALWRRLEGGAPLLGTLEDM